MSQEFFKTHVVPRRVRDLILEQDYLKRTQKTKKFYRKVYPDEGETPLT